MMRILLTTISAVGILFLSACGKTEKPPLQYMPHMANTPVLKAQRGYSDHKNGAGVLLPPEGTIPRGFKPYRFQSADEAEAQLKNPLPITKETMARGQKMYGIYCAVCHGDKGLGDGPVVPPFPIPKSLQSEQMQKWKDGHLFHVITKGQAVMPSYAQQVSEEDRWAIIHYVRALQRAENPSSEDIRIYKSRKVN